MMAMFVHSVLGFSIATTYAYQMCTRFNYLRSVEEGNMLPNYQIGNLTTSGIMTCSRACLIRRKCKSFNFNVRTGECQLNQRSYNGSSLQLKKSHVYCFSGIVHWPEDLLGACASHSCPLNSYCYPVNNTEHVCRITGCISVKCKIENGHLNETSEESPLGTVLSPTCDPGYLPQGEVVCQRNGTWSSPVCVSVSSCSMVKQYQPDSEDGEYWLRLPNFNNYTAKIYCQGIATITPAVFVTLPNINFGIFPRVSNFECKGESELWFTCVGDGWEVWYSKTRVNITNMNVSINDATFANISNSGKHHGYGIAMDCYTEHENGDLNCGTRGKFIIDLQGTGWRVSEDQNWKTCSWKPMIQSIDRQMNGTRIILRCGGFRGGCRPKGGLMFPFSCICTVK